MHSYLDGDMLGRPSLSRQNHGVPMRRKFWMTKELLELATRRGICFNHHHLRGSIGHILADEVEAAHDWQCTPADRRDRI
jgi:hypothetical protein